MDKEMKLAVLIDAENIASKYVELILAEANSLGSIIYKRIYGNWTTSQMSSWRNVILDYSIQPIQQFNNINGKNSSDSSLIIDAMDLLYLGRLDGFCIVSSDSDFTRLAARLRESGMFVLGMGEQKTPRSFISACNKFSYLDIISGGGAAESSFTTDKETPEAESAEVKKAEPTTEKPAKKQSEEKPGYNLDAIKRSVKELTEEHSDDEGWIFSSKLNVLLNKRFPDFDVRNFGHKKFLPFIMSLDMLELKRDETNTKLVYFRLK